ncbi:cyclic diguanylate phosphodiesterase domain protein [Mycobacterium avium subsp. avium 2285 (R)]|nr:cyclic diguanylate phosphodiesterase domain protein [Mycobacterium avium subsp. avium 2285 (R)]
MKRWAVNPWRRSGVPARVGWLLAGGYGTAALLVLLSSVRGWRGPYGTRPVDDLVMFVCLAVAAMCAARAAGPRPDGAGTAGWR